MRTLHHPGISAPTNPFYWPSVCVFALFASAFIATASANASTVAIGNKLVVDSKCEACHASKVGGDGSQIYLRKDRRVTALSKLQPQVARCNTDLNLGLFPEDEAAIAAYLNANYYKFKD